MNELTMVRLSTTTYRIKCYEDQEKTIPLDLDGLPLVFLAKTKIADTDDLAIFSLSIGSGLTIDPLIPANNELIVTVSSANTSSLPVAKDTTLYCELLVTGASRQTLGQLTIPVRASVKQT